MNAQLLIRSAMPGGIVYGRWYSITIKGCKVRAAMVNRRGTLHVAFPGRQNIKDQDGNTLRTYHGYQVYRFTRSGDLERESFMCSDPNACGIPVPPFDISHINA